MGGEFPVSMDSLANLPANQPIYMCVCVLGGGGGLQAGELPLPLVLLSYLLPRLIPSSSIGKYQGRQEIVQLLEMYVSSYSVVP